MKIKILLLGLLLFSSSVFAETYYVSPNGTGNGLSYASPDSLADVKTTVAGLTLTEDVTVYLLGGTYDLSAGGLTFTSADSGTATYKITWRNAPGETPVLDGGTYLSTSWSETTTGVYRTTNTLDIDSIFVEGVRADKSRWGTSTALTHVANSPLQKSFSSATFPATITNPADVDLVASGSDSSHTGINVWRHATYGTTAINKAGSTVTLTFNSNVETLWTNVNVSYFGGYWVRNDLTRASWFEGAVEFLDNTTTGYFTNDSANNYLYYVPRNATELTKLIANNLEVVIPTTEKLININGASYIDFKGITLKHANWSMPTTDRVNTGNQAGSYLPASDWQGPAYELYDNRWVYWPTGAIDIATGSHHLGFYGLTITKGNGAGIMGLQNIDDVQIVHNNISYMGSSGVNLGRGILSEDCATANQSSNYAITDNVVHDTGEVYPNSIGIRVAYGDTVTIQRNHIYNLPYTGISAGWGWAPSNPFWAEYNWTAPGAENDFTEFEADYSTGFDIQYNHVHDVVSLLRDGGGIYTVGWGHNSQVKNNWVYGVGAASYVDTIPIYHDEGATHWDTQANVVDRNQINQNNNYAIRATTDQPGPTRGAGVLQNDFNLTNNYVVGGAINHISMSYWVEQASENGVTPSGPWGTTGTVTGNTTVSAGYDNYPAAAQMIADNAEINIPGTALLQEGASTATLSAWSGASLYYSLDGQLPYQEYSAPFSINGVGDIYYYAEEGGYLGLVKLYQLLADIFDPTGTKASRLLTLLGQTGGTIIPWN